jgi:hypothetical protein
MKNLNCMNMINELIIMRKILILLFYLESMMIQIKHLTLKQDSIYDDVNIMKSQNIKYVI